MPCLVKEDLDWCVHRMRPYVKQLMRDHPRGLFVAGGFIRSCIANETVNDIDMFAPTVEAARQYADWIARETRYSLHESGNAFTIRTRPYATQIIHRWTFDTPDSCIASFDYTIAKAAIWHDGEQWVSACDERFYADLAAKRLVYCSPVREEEAGGSMLRLLKFYQRGYRVPMDSLGAIIGRIASSAGDSICDGGPALDEIITGLLREVDPDIDPNHASHLPSSTTQAITTLFQPPIPRHSGVIPGPTYTVRDEDEP